MFRLDTKISLLKENGVLEPNLGSKMAIFFVCKRNFRLETNIWVVKIVFSCKKVLGTNFRPHIVIFGCKGCPCIDCVLPGGLVRLSGGQLSQGLNPCSLPAKRYHAAQSSSLMRCPKSKRRILRGDIISVKGGAKWFPTLL